MVSGAAYERYALQLAKSAKRFLQVPHRTVILQGRPGWPAATLYRYHALLDREWEEDYLFLCDADMRFESEVGEEILGEIVATLHPGYAMRSEKPYYCGAFVGGEREAFLELATYLKWRIDADDDRRIMAEWHDETHLNRELALHPPAVTLGPGYCFPDDASGYPWLKGVERKLVALDKTPSEKAGR